MDISQRCYCSLFGLGWFATWCFKSCDYFLPLQFLGTSFFRSLHPLCTFQCLGTFTTFTSILSLLLGKCSMCGWLHGMGAWKDPRASSTKRIFVRNSKGFIFSNIWLFFHHVCFSVLIVPLCTWTHRTIVSAQLHSNWSQQKIRSKSCTYISSHSIRIQSLMNPFESHFLQSHDVFSNISGCVSILTAFCLWDSASMGPSVDPFHHGGTSWRNTLYLFNLFDSLFHSHPSSTIWLRTVCSLSIFTG